MERVEGGRQWGAWQGVMEPADQLKAACDAAGGWLRVGPVLSVPHNDAQCSVGCVPSTCCCQVIQCAIAGCCAGGERTQNACNCRTIV